jgi:hypothetical protein
MTPPQRSTFVELGKLLAAANNAITERKGAMPNQCRTWARH